MQEEDARHVDATTLVGIRVRRENLKTIKPRVGFWPTVFECEKIGGINLEDLKFVVRNVQ
jgi:hypothetical protein